MSSSHNFVDFDDENHNTHFRPTTCTGDLRFLLKIFLFLPTNLPSVASRYTIKEDLAVYYLASRLPDKAKVWGLRVVCVQHAISFSHISICSLDSG